MTETAAESARELRRRAEEKLGMLVSRNPASLSSEKTDEILHELRVHQIELEMQNEELRWAQYELAASRALYFDLFDLAPVGYLTFNKQGLMQNANLTAASMLGVTRNVLLKNLMSQLIFPEDEELYALNRKQVVENGTQKTWDMRLIRADGSYFWAHLQASPGNNGDYLITFSDITEYRRAEESLKSTENKYSRLFESMTDAYVSVDMEGRIVESNTLYQQMTGYSAEELQSLTYTQLTPDRWHALEAEIIEQQVIPRGYSDVYQKEYRTKSGVTIDVELKTYLLKDDDGTPAGMWAIIRDITRRKLAELKLRESRGRLKAYIDNSFDVIFALNADGAFQFVSQAWERHFGYSFKEVIGKKFSVFVHPEDVAPSAEYLTHILNGGVNRTSPPFRVKRSDGSWRCFVANCSRYLDTNNESQIIGVAHDITDQQETEQKLHQAKEAAEAASIAKSDFLSTVSHEIRTPLGAMLGNVELLEGSPLTPQQQEYLKDCKSATQMLLQVINDVLDFSKIEAGKLELVNETFSIASLSRQLVRIFTASARQKGLELSVSLDDNLPEYISGDPQRLRQIMANLINNAIKFTNHGTVSLRITREQTPGTERPDRAVLGIVVRDTGIGIPADKQDSIFESFTQIERFSTRSVSGTGLGLPISRRLLALMGGSISVASVPGEGSVFTVVLPVAVAQAQAQAQAQDVADRTEIPSRKVLLADDDELGRAVAQKLLQRRGYQVTAVENGAELLDALQKEKFEIVLTDISMPDMEGTQVAKIIRSGERNGIDRNIPIIAMTAHAFSDDHARFLASGINGYVAKPVNLEELFRQIEELCERIHDP